MSQLPKTPTISEHEESITELLDRVHDSGETLEDLLRRVYTDLRQIARRQIKEQGSPGSLHTTLVADDIVAGLIAQRNAFHNRGQFFAIAKTIAVRVILDAIKHAKAKKRGGGVVPAPLQIDPHARDTHEPPDPEQLAALRDALESLGEADPLTAEIVTLRSLGGMTNAQIAEHLEMTPQQVDTKWRLGKRWLARALQTDED